MDEHINNDETIGTIPVSLQKIHTDNEYIVSVNHDQTQIIKIDHEGTLKAVDLEGDSFEKTIDYAVKNVFSPDSEISDDKIAKCFIKDMNWQRTIMDYVLLIEIRDALEQYATRLFRELRHFGYVYGERVYIIGEYARVMAKTYVVQSMDSISFVTNRGR